MAVNRIIIEIALAVAGFSFAAAIYLSGVNSCAPSPSQDAAWQRFIQDPHVQTTGHPPATWP